MQDLFNFQLWVMQKNKKHLKKHCTSLEICTQDSFEKKTNPICIFNRASYVMELPSESHISRTSLKSYKICTCPLVLKLYKRFAPKPRRFHHFCHFRKKSSINLLVHVNLKQNMILHFFYFNVRLFSNL